MSWYIELKNWLTPAWWNWHKKWPLRDLLCKLERHDFDHARIDGEDIVIKCFYCQKGRKCVRAAQNKHNAQLNELFLLWEEPEWWEAEPEVDAIRCPICGKSAKENRGAWKCVHGCNNDGMGKDSYKWGWQWGIVAILSHACIAGVRAAKETKK